MKFFQVFRDTAELTYGNPFVGIDEAIWVERYNAPDEVMFIGDPPSIQGPNPLTPGMWVTHDQTRCIMEIQKVFIEEAEDSPPKLVATGKDILSVIMDNRIVNKSVTDIITWSSFSNPETPDMIQETYAGDMHVKFEEYYPWEQAEILINGLCIASSFTQESIDDFAIYQTLETSGGDAGTFINYQEFPMLCKLSTAVYMLAQKNDFGVKIELPSETWGPEINTIIHEGMYLGDPESEFYVKFTRTKNHRQALSNDKNHNGFYSNVGGFTLRSYRDDPLAPNSGWDARHTSTTAPDWPLLSAEEAAPDTEIYPYLFKRGGSSYFPPGDFNEFTIVNPPEYMYGVDYNIGDYFPVGGKYIPPSVPRLVEHATIINKDGHEQILSFRPRRFTGGPIYD